MCIRILQRNRVFYIYYIYIIYIIYEIAYRGLLFIKRYWLAIVWRLKIPLSALWKLETQEIWWCSSKALQPESRWCRSSPGPKTWEPGVLRAEDWCPSLFSQAGSKSTFLCLLVLFRPSVDWMMPAPPPPPPILGRAIRFTQCTNSNANLFGNTLRHTRNNVLPDIWASCGHVRLAHKINHHKMLSGYPSRDSGLRSWICESGI